jgi:hypothetical protein
VLAAQLPQDHTTTYPSNVRPFNRSIHFC